MITEFLMGLGVTLLEAVMGAVPAVALPSWLSSVLGGMATVMGFVGSFSYWLPVGLLMPALVAVFAAMNAGLLIRVGRVVVSLFTGGGGSAG